MRKGILVFLVACAVALSVSPGWTAIIAQCTAASNSGSVVSTTWTHAQAFAVTAETTATEVQLNLSRWGGSSGTFTMYLYADVNGYPGGVARASVSKAVSIVPLYEPTWTSFKWGGTGLSIGTYWIVCKVSANCDAEITCHGAGANACGTGRDAMTSFDGGSTWPVLQKSDINYVVYGSRTPVSTTTTITIDPSSITTGGVSKVTVSVRDSGANFIPGPGAVTLRASSGSLGSTSLTLCDGEASTTYTAPMSSGSYSVVATYQGHSFGGNDYQGSNSSANVLVTNQNRGTTTAQVLASGSVNTRGTVSITVTVRDSLSAFVPGGKVTFEAAGGTCTPNPASVSFGIATTTFTAGTSPGSYNIKADYSGFVQGGVNYAPSTDTDLVTVNLVPLATSTSLTVSPDPCYINKSAYVRAVVTQGGSRVPGGSVLFTAPTGSFDNQLVATADGVAWTKWTAPGVTGSVNITATYQQHDSNGYQYMPSANTKAEVVNKDPDGSDPGLSYLLEWNTNYSDKPLDDCGIEAQAFGSKLAGIGWSGEEWSNGDAWEKDMKADWWFHSGNENSVFDTNDIAWYSGHGNGDCITFITNKDDKYLRHDEVYDLLGNGNWGDKDAEWLCLSACQVMSKASYWASTMDGLHCICGFISNSSDQQKLGKAFAGLLIKDSVDDAPYTISQAWFLAGDMSQPLRKKMRVIGQTDACLDDYLWGYGTVAADPSDDSTYSYVDHDVLNYNPPTADAGGPYTVKAGDVLTLDGRGCVEPDAESILYIAWDMQTGVDTDDRDLDYDGVDEADDDADVWGSRAQWTYASAGVHNIRQLCVDDRYKIDDDSTTVTVTVSSTAPPASGAIALEEGGITIVDDYPFLPPESSLPLFRSNANTLGFNEASTIQDGFGMSGDSRIDDLGNWVMTTGQNQTIVNDYTGSVMYVNTNRAYRFNGPPPGLPDPVQTFVMADTFLAASGIQHDGSVHGDVTDVSYGAVTEMSQSTPPRLPFQRRANYSRTLDVDGTLYPVVGPGGRIAVTFEQPANPFEPTQYIKIWRDVYKAEDMSLYPASQAIADFHRIGPAALIHDSKIPDCSLIEIKNVYLAYYEQDFSTPQSVLYPVYVLDMRCFNDNSSFWVTGYLPALTAPVEASISSPADGSEVEYDTTVHLEGSAAGGQSPYSYEWYSDIDGLLASGSSTDVVLSGSQKSGEVRSHTITLRATDQQVLTDSASVAVKVMPTEPSSAVRKPDGAPVWIYGPVVTGFADGRYYVEEADRSAGIAVEPTTTMVEGDVVSVTGVVQTIQGERIVTAPQCEVLSAGNELPRPLLMKSPSLGGSYEIPFPMGVSGAPDVYNLGLLVHTSGWVRQVGPDYFYLDDGGSLKDGSFTGPEENIGIRVICASAQVVPGQYVLVTGISSSFESVPGMYARRVLTRSAGDVVVLAGP